VEYTIELTQEEIEKLEELTGIEIQNETDAEHAISIVLAEL
jgi:hypothetical protein